MKAFLVNLTIFVAGFEKTANTLVTAPIKELAGEFAIALEAHEPESMEWGGDHVTEMGYEFAYGATSVVEVSPADAATLGKYMTLWEFDLDKLKASGNWWDSYTKDQQDEIESLVSDQDSKPDPVPPTYTAKFAEFGDDISDVTHAIIIKEGFATDSEAYRWIFETWVRSKVETEYAYRLLKFINNTEITHFNTVDAPDDINEAAAEYCGKLTDRQVADVCDWYFTDQLPRDGMQFVYDVEEIVVSDQK